jgi:hypothetical protein
MSKFQGIAFWTVATQAPDWMDRAEKTLEPIGTEGIGNVQRRDASHGNELMVVFGGCQHQIMIGSNGNGRGLVRPAPSAGAFVVCLSALSRSVGDISIVDDAQQVVPTLPRQSCPAYAGNWDLVVQAAQALGLMPNRKFMERNRALLNRMF